MRKITKSILGLAVLLQIQLQSQSTWTTTFENREEFRHFTQLPNTNYVLSGQTNELGNKSDLVILLDNVGNEIARKVICPTCSSGHIVSTKYTLDDELIHVRSNGDIFMSNLDLSNTRFLLNVGAEYDFTETYQTLYNSDHMAVVSSAVKDNVRGLLHTTIYTTGEEIIWENFNTTFPEISGSIGISQFRDVSVIDGYNEVDDNGSTPHLLKYDVKRDLLWEKTIDFGNINIERAVVSWQQQIFVVGTIEDERHAGHWQGIVMAFDSEGGLLWETRYDSKYLDNSEYEEPAKKFTNIIQSDGDQFIISGYDSGFRQGEEKGEAFVIRINDKGEILRSQNTSEITELSYVVEAKYNDDWDIAYLGIAEDRNRISGSFFGVMKNKLTSTKNESFDNKFEIFPNPTSDYITIRGAKTGMSRIKIYAADGSLQLSTSFRTRLSVSDLPSGKYYVVLTDAKSTPQINKFYKLKE